MLFVIYVEQTRARAGFRRILEKRIRRIQGLEIFSGLNMIGSVLNPKTLSPSLNCDAASLAENEDEMEGIAGNAHKGGCERVPYILNSHSAPKVRSARTGQLASYSLHVTEPSALSNSVLCASTCLQTTSIDSLSRPSVGDLLSLILSLSRLPS